MEDSDTISEAASDRMASSMKSSQITAAYQSITKLDSLLGRGDTDNEYDRIKRKYLGAGASPSPKGADEMSSPTKSQNLADLLKAAGKDPNRLTMDSLESMFRDSNSAKSMTLIHKANSSFKDSHKVQHFTPERANNSQKI